MIGPDAKWRMDVTEWFKGGVIVNAEIARKFAELVLEYTQDKEELELQTPLTVEDQGDAWLIQGSRNRDKSQEGPGPFHMTVKKRDAQLVDVGIPWVVKLAPEDQEYLRSVLRGTGYLPPKE